MESWPGGLLGLANRNPQSPPQVNRRPTRHLRDPRRRKSRPSTTDGRCSSAEDRCVQGHLGSGQIQRLIRPTPAMFASRAGTLPLPNGPTCAMSTGGSRPCSRTRDRAEVLQPGRRRPGGGAVQLMLASSPSPTRDDPCHTTSRGIPSPVWWSGRTSDPRPRRGSPGVRLASRRQCPHCPLSSTGTRAPLPSPCVPRIGK